MPKQSNLIIILLAIIAAGVIGCLVLLLKGGMPLQTSPTPQAAQVSAPAKDTIVEGINARVAQLVGKPRTIELTSEKAVRARNAIKQGDFATAGKIISDVLAQSKMENWHFYPFNIFMPAVDDPNDPAFTKQLDDWVSREPASAIPRLARARNLLDIGWAKRGERTADKTQDQDFMLFDRYLNAAVADIDEAIRLDPKDPYAFWLKLRILTGDGNTPEAAAAFQQAIAAFPDYYSVYETRLDNLVPKWGGSIDEMYDFVDKYAASAPQYSPMKILYLDLYNQLIDTARFACSEIGGEAWKGCYVATMGRLERPALDKGIREALDLYKHVDDYQYNKMLEENLISVEGSAPIDNHAAAILQMAAEKTGSDNQMIETNPGHNNYVMDFLTALEWQNKGDYDDSEKKYKETLQDIASAPFPGEEEKDQTLAHIYGDFAALYMSKAQYVDAIVYQSAAEALSGGTGYSHLVCYNYYLLTDYPAAINECTKVIDKTNEMEARYWRGMSYLRMGNKEAAEKDLGAVADSDWQGRIRSSAAIQLTVLYGERKDLAGELAFMDKHAYLFDEKGQAKDDLAVAFNNRCWVYMQQGELQKALDDCNTSLRYGNVPDAIIKRKQLIERLGAHEKGI